MWKKLHSKWSVWKTASSKSPWFRHLLLLFTQIRISVASGEVTFSRLTCDLSGVRRVWCVQHNCQPTQMAFAGMMWQAAWWQPQWLKQKFILSQMWGPEVQHRDHWAEVKAEVKLPLEVVEETRLLASCSLCGGQHYLLLSGLFQTSLCLSLVTALVVGFNAHMIIQDNLSSSRFLASPNQQRPFFLIRYHVRFQERRPTIFGWSSSAHYR